MSCGWCEFSVYLWLGCGEDLSLRRAAWFIDSEISTDLHQAQHHQQAIVITVFPSWQFLIPQCLNKWPALFSISGKSGNGIRCDQACGTLCNLGFTCQIVFCLVIIDP